jgi:zinc protease
MRLALSALLLFAHTAAASSAVPHKVVAYEGVSEYRLDNGLRLLLVPDHTLGTVTVSIHYNVGSAVEGSGDAGLAHLFEHMLFKATKRHGNLWVELQKHGARMDGWTWVDSTRFYETLPASDANLDFAIDLEADRMVNSRLDPADLAKEALVVRNELEQDDSNVRHLLLERMLASAYRFHGYGRSTIGTRSDLEHVPIERLREFYHRWYRPDNATLVIAGRFDEARALDQVQRQFGVLPRPTTPLPARYTVEPAQDGEHEVTLRGAGDVPIVGLMYHGVAASADDYAAQMAFTDIMTRRSTGRLQKALVERGLAASVETYVWPWKEPGVLQLYVALRPGQAIDPTRVKLLDVMERATPVQPEELERFKRRTLKEMQLELVDVSDLATDLGEWAVRGDWRLFFRLRDRVQALDATAVDAFARRYIKPSNRTLGLFVPTAKPDRAPLTTAPDAAPLVQAYSGGTTETAGEAIEPTLTALDAHTQRSQLANGMRILMLPKATRGHAVRLVLAVPYGSVEALRGRHAAVSALGEMLLRGTRRHSRAQLEDEWDRLQAVIEPGPGLNDAEVRYEVLTTRAQLPALVAQLAELLSEPVFAANELETYRKEQLAQLQEAQENVEEQLRHELRRTLRPPFARDDVRRTRSLEESIADLRALKLGDLQALARMLGGSAAALAIVGDFDAKATEAALKKSFGAWKSAQPFAAFDRPLVATRPFTDIVKLTDKPMAKVAVGQALPLREDDPDYAALELAGYILGGGMDSRLNQRLREHEALSKGAYAYAEADARDHRGRFVAQAQCAAANAARTLAGIREEVARLVNDAVPDDELAKQKQSMRLELQGQLASDGYIAGILVDQALVGRTLATLAERERRQQALTPAELQATLRKHLQPASMGTVEVGDIKGDIK